MKSKRTIAVVISSRASYARIKRALRMITIHPALECRVIACASALLDRYGSSVSLIEEDGFRVDARVYMVIEGENPISMAKTTGVGILELATVFDQLKPDMVLTIADRYETMATAIVASYCNIPLVHVQGGERTGSVDEKVRHAVSKLANLHFVANQSAKERLIRMGEEETSIYVTGCPSIDLAMEVSQNGKADLSLPFEKYGGVGAKFDLSSGYAVAMQHPVTTEYGEALPQVTETLEAVAELGLPTLWFWPNVDAGSDGISKGIRTFREKRSLPKVHFFKNMAPEDFLAVVNRSRCVVGNSSVGIRECSFLGVPVVNIGTRQQGRDRGRNVIDVDYSKEEIKKAVREQWRHEPFPSENIYGDGRAGERIANLLSEAPLKIEKFLTY